MNKMHEFRGDSSVVDKKTEEILLAEFTTENERVNTLLALYACSSREKESHFMVFFRVEDISSQADCVGVSPDAFEAIHNGFSSLLRVCNWLLGLQSAIHCMFMWGEEIFSDITNNSSVMRALLILVDRVECLNEALSP